MLRVSANPGTTISAPKNIVAIILKMKNSDLIFLIFVTSPKKPTTMNPCNTYATFLLRVFQIDGDWVKPKPVSTSVLREERLKMPLNLLETNSALFKSVVKLADPEV